MTMTNRIKFIFLTFTLLTTTLAQASWNPASLHWAESFSQEQVKFQDPDVITVWSGFQAAHLAQFQPLKKEIVDVRLSSSQFKTGSLTSKFFAQKDDTGKMIAAPLIVFLPGIFDSFEKSIGLRAFYNYSRRGYHVLGIPNPWSVPYISESPRTEPSNIGVEAAVMLELIQNFKKFIGSDHVTRIELVGESYGGLLATAVFAIDAHRAERLIDGPVTVFSPPLDLVVASQALDGILSNPARLLHGPCAIAREGAKFILDLLTSDTETEMSKPTRSCARALLAQSFMSRLANTALVYESVHGLHTIPNRYYHPAAYDTWHKQLRFSTFLDRYLPEEIDAGKKQRALLSYWITNTPDAFKNEFRFVTAQDDMLNVPARWHEVTEVLPPNSLITLPWGGHIGFEGLPEFEDLLDTSFGRVHVH